MEDKAIYYFNLSILLRFSSKKLRWKKKRRCWKEKSQSLNKRSKYVINESLKRLIFYLRQSTSKIKKGRKQKKVILFQCQHICASFFWERRNEQKKLNDLHECPLCCEFMFLPSNAILFGNEKLCLTPLMAGHINPQTDNNWQKSIIYSTGMNIFRNKINLNKNEYLSR